MIDVNLGNKTLVVGVAIALILSYGMVNFNGGETQSTRAFPAVSAATMPVTTAPEVAADAPVETVAQAVSTVDGVDTSALSSVQQSIAADDSSEDDSKYSPRRRALRAN